MKKILIIMTAIILFSAGCSSKLKTYQQITLKDFKNKIENKESFILYIGAKNCEYCEKYVKKLNKVIKENQVTVYYIDVALFNKEESEDFNTYIQYSGTPTTVFIKDGVEETTYNRIVGNQTITTIIDKLKINGYIKN